MSEILKKYEWYMMSFNSDIVHQKYYHMWAKHCKGGGGGRGVLLKILDRGVPWRVVQEAKMDILCKAQTQKKTPYSREPNNS